MSEMKFQGLLAGAAVGAMVAFSGGAANAATLVDTIDGNDCVGVWDSAVGGESGCRSPLEYGDSPIIAKFDVSETTGAISASYNNSAAFFPSIDGSEFSLTVTGDTVDWTYTAGLFDPNILTVAVKYGPRFDVWYDGGAAITSGTFTTDSGQDISHVSFYDSDGGGAPPITAVPLPAGLPLILAGLGVFGALRLRKQKTA